MQHCCKNKHYLCKCNNVELKFLKKKDETGKKYNRKNKDFGFN